MRAALLDKLRAVAGLIVFVAVTAAVFWLLFALLDLRDSTRGDDAVVRIGSKADTEGILLAEILALGTE
jgi:glycine betaine/choline ABC-type transport system substrate-binding protein